MGPRAVPVTGDVWQVGGPGLTAPEDAAVYLIAEGNRAALVDSGSGHATDRLLANVEASGVDATDIGLLLLTHCHFDHTGGARELRQRLGCSVVAHALDAGFIEDGDDEVTAASWYGATLQPCVVDRKLTAPREDIALGGLFFTAIHIPGHSPGSVAYVLDSGGEKVVFAQDVHGPLHPSLLSNQADYQASLQRLINLRADILCEGHFGIFRGGRAIEAFIRRFMTS